MLVSLSSTATGCAGKSRILIPPQVNAQVENQQKAVTVIQAEAHKAEALAPVVKPHTDIIINEASKIDAAATEIKNNHALVTKDASTRIEVLQNSNDKLSKENVKLKNDNNKLLNKWLAVTIFGSGLSLAIFVALFLMGKLQDLTLAVIAGACLLGAITLQFLVAYAIWIGLAVCLFMGGSIVYRVFLSQKANKENVATTEAVKQLLPPEEKQAFKDLANEIQSTTTMKIVKDIRTKNAARRAKGKGPA
jgi:hypothetical protein